MTTGTPDTARWRRRFEEFRSSLALLVAANDERLARPLSLLETAGFVQYFELTIESGRKTLASYMQASGVDLPVLTPFAVFKAAMSMQIIDDGDLWMAALKDRNQMSHAYDPIGFEELPARISADYLPMFAKLVEHLTGQ